MFRFAFEFLFNKNLQYGFRVSRAESYQENYGQRCDLDLGEVLVSVGVEGVLDSYVELGPRQVI